MNYLEFRQNAFRTFSNIEELYPGITNKKLISKLQKLHCVVGIMTEIQEMEQGAILGDVVNMKEELGDMLWYIANYDNTISLVEGEDLENFDDAFVNKQQFLMDVGPLKYSAELLLDLWKKNLYYNTTKHDKLIDDTLAKLKHDVVKFCQKAGWDITKIMNTNILKLQARYPEKFSTENADNRDLDTERAILEN